jgi:outer membrane receptor protein involved in Fe transport
VRLDRYALLVSATHASPRVNVAFQVGGGAVVHASYDHFFVPSPIEGVLSGGAGLTKRIREIGIPLPPLQPTTENQFEIGASAPAGPFRLALTGYHRATDNPVHTTVWPDARIYSYASFDRARAYGLEAKAEVPAFARYGVTGYLNYALGRVYFYNPVTGGFVTEAEHLTETSRFLAPMDQTHTLTTGVTFRHPTTGVWIGTAMEYGSGTPMEHGGAGHEHAAGEADHVDAESSEGAARVPGHFTVNFSTGIDLWRDGDRRPKLALQVDLENVTDNRYLIAQEGEFSPRQFSIPRLISVTAKFRF